MTTTELALDIADESEASYIETCCDPRFSQGSKWYDVGPIADATDEEIFGAGIRRAVAYLTDRGLIIRHPSIPHFVRIKNSSKLGRKSRRAFSK